MAKFLSVVSGLDWETCRKVIEKHVPGGVAQAMKDADTFFGSYLPALSAWQFGAKQAATIAQPVLSVLGTETDPLVRGQPRRCSTPGFHGSKTARSRASATCCTCNVQSR